MPIDLYDFPGSGPCRAVHMTAVHIGLEINKKKVDLFAGEQMKPEFLEVSSKIELFWSRITLIFVHMQKYMNKYCSTCEKSPFLKLNSNEIA